MIDILKNISVLLVEDEENIALLLKEAIGDYFQEFILAIDGKDGIDKYNKYLPDLIITDITMPKMTGLEMAKELKRKKDDIQIIILSAFSETDKLLSAIDLGVIKYFIKPFDPDELLDYIKTIAPKIKHDFIFLLDDFKFNMSQKRLYKNDNFIKLTKREEDFIYILLSNTSNIINDKFLKEQLWDDDNVSDERLRTFIKRLRLKTSKDLISNIKGKGYKIILK